jgi:hypothetical protein
MVEFCFCFSRGEITGFFYRSGIPSGFTIIPDSTKISGIPLEFYANF